eukprot:Nk52_evm12s2284 gene=Nk52_evmTU12s2284
MKKKKLINLSREWILAQLNISSGECAKVKSLLLPGTDAEGIIKLTDCLKYFPRLEILDLSHNHISSLSPLATVLSLKELRLCSNNISNVEEFKWLDQLPHLEKLCIAGNPIGNDSKIAIIIRSYLPRLKYLDEKALHTEPRPFKREHFGGILSRLNNEDLNESIDLAMNLNLGSKSDTKVQYFGEKLENAIAEAEISHRFDKIVLTAMECAVVVAIPDSYEDLLKNGACQGVFSQLARIVDHYYRREMGKLSKRVTEMEQKCEGVQSERDELSERANSLQKALQNATLTGEQTSTEISLLREENVQLKARVNNLNETVAVQKNSLQELNSSFAEMKQGDLELSKAYKKEISKLKNENHSLKKLSESFRNDAKSTADSYRDLSATVSMLRDTHSVILKQNESLAAENERLKREKDASLSQMNWNYNQLMHTVNESLFRDGDGNNTSGASIGEYHKEDKENSFSMNTIQTTSGTPQ